MPHRYAALTGLAFYFYYLRQVWPSFAALLVVGLVGALIEVALFSYLSRIIDLVNHSTPATLFHDNWPTLLWMGCVALILRPVFIALHDMLVHQSINPGMTSMIRWQHHNYVLRQSMNFSRTILRAGLRSAFCKPATRSAILRCSWSMPSGMC